MVDEREQRKIDARRRKVRAAENRQLSVEYRKMGMSYDAIGKQLGISAQAAHKAVGVAMRQLRVKQDTDAADLKVVELDTLDRLQLAAWPLAMKGSAIHIDKIMKILERRANIAGPREDREFTAIVKITRTVID